MIHKIYFYKNPISKINFAVCSCGWTLNDVNAQWVQERAAVHDLTEGDKDNEATGVRKA